MRVVGHISTIRRLRKLIKIHSIYLLVLQEHLVSNATTSVICKILCFLDCVFSDNNKVWMLWNDNLSIQVLSQSEQFLQCTTKHPSFLFHKIFM